MLTFALLLASITASALSQYWQKRAALQFVAQPELSALQKLFSPAMLLAICSLGIGAVCWLGVLSHWDVSLAYPLLSINFVVMLLVSHYCFGERISSRQWIGSALIMLGVVLLGAPML